MRKLFRFLFEGPKYDPSTLMEIEKALFKGISQQWHPNIAFISMALQLKEWVRVASAENFGGISNWLKRQEESGVMDVTMKGQHIVGGEYCLPVTEGNHFFRFPYRSGSDILPGEVTIDFDQFIRRYTIKPLAGYSREIVSNLSIDQPQIQDDKAYWDRVVLDASWIQPLKDAVLNMLSSPSLEDVPITVFPAPPIEGSIEIEGIRVEGLYRALLHFSNGINVGYGQIYGDENISRRVIVFNGVKYLDIGHSDGKRYFLKIKDHAVTDELFLDKYDLNRIKPINGGLPELVSSLIGD